MYHYVRDPDFTEFPGLKVRKVDEFRAQLRKLHSQYRFISGEELIDAIVNGTKLPAKSALVSFDDGYIDHFINVLPVLESLGIKGMFFPSAQPILEGKVMAANKIHHILAAPEVSSTAILGDIKAYLSSCSSKPVKTSFEKLWFEYGRASTFDDEEVTFIKNVLQRGLEKVYRDDLLDQLFSKYVKYDELALSTKLYMSQDQLRTLVSMGHYVGGHGFSHNWFSSMGLDQFCEELDLTRNFLSLIGAPTTNWIMCYPFGSPPGDFAECSVQDILKSRSCAAGLIDHGGEADLQEQSSYKITRIDTLHVPF
jgi:peptidoglycan/xylan/chitin deacetylase (PgdA/CDA1 family)